MDIVDLIVAQWEVERPDIDASPMHVIGRISRLAADLDPLLAPVFTSRGLGDGEFDVLATLRRSGEPFELSPGDLGASMMVTSGAVTKRVDRLERSGLVTRRVSEVDARARLIKLTAKGRTIVDEAVVDHVANEERLLSGLSADERETLAGLLRKLGESIDTLAGRNAAPVQRG
ncbi:MarR family winged helix-turn-helix transcriptional regulator [Aeromicrobium sp. 9AM]|uniref:MarR family winged helix-turn-helix transcriptional regulator n=1 Tax=Aeromicrobium sp. 9AM TaxID=2653126 RepID=UPI0012EF9DA4|nr:MarR family transcriptional regulator [Aeromicrobium sp. 9AM]VXC15783.1 HTH-type transcriptional regulator PecS [Aeromicrobium sp. 9AM]